MNIGTDYSNLFSSLSGRSSSAVSSSNFLADYASIKNGTYLKLMKAYYAKVESEDSGKTGTKRSISTSTDKTKTLAKIKSDTDALKDSANALVSKGSNSLFSKKAIETTKEDGSKTTSMDYDRDAIYKAVKSFADDYNAVIGSAGNANSTSVLRQTMNMTAMTKSYSGLLNSVGITVGSDNKLTVDENTFKKADINTVKTLFNGNASYAYNVATRSSMVGVTASTESNRANTYNSQGAFGNNFSSGNIYNSFF